jgi:hypothetical protein
MTLSAHRATTPRPTGRPGAVVFARIALLVLLVAVQLPSAVRADIPASGLPNRDAGPYTKCTSTYAGASKSSDALDAALRACLNSFLFYSDKAQGSKTETDGCYYDYYGGSSALRYSHLLAKIGNAEGSQNARILGIQLLTQVVNKCHHEPHAVHAAKAQMDAITPA